MSTGLVQRSSTSQAARSAGTAGSSGVAGTKHIMAALVNSGVTASTDDVQVTFGYPHSVGLECGRGGDDGAAALELEAVRRPPHPLQMSASTG